MSSLLDNLTERMLAQKTFDDQRAWLGRAAGHVRQLREDEMQEFMRRYGARQVDLYFAEGKDRAA